MTSEHDSARPRHIGRLVDPMVSDDGDLEPKLELAESANGLAPPSPINSPDAPSITGASSSSDESSTAATSSIVSEPSTSTTLTRDAPIPHIEATSAMSREGDATSHSHPVRERLLAKAREHAHSPVVNSDATSERFSSLSGLNEELERIARAPTTSHRPKRMRLAGSPLSPNMIAIFGTLFGLATLASLFAVLIHLSPNNDQAIAPASASASADTERPEIKAPTPAPSAIVPEPPARKVREKIPGPWRIADSTDANLKHVEGKIGTLSFLKAVQAAGIDTQQSYRIFASLKDQKNLNRCRKKDSFAALVDRTSQRVVAFEYIVGKEEVYQAKEADHGLLVGKRLDLKVEREQLSGAITLLTDSFGDAVEKAGFEPGISTTLNKALDGHTNVEQFRRGDRLRLIAQEVSVLGEFSRYAGIEALEYVPADGSSPIRIYYFEGSQTKSYVNAKGQLTSERGWRKPIKGAPITSPFNLKRMHPILHVIKPHEGTDFGAAMGTPVGASLYGTVSYVGPLGPNGNFVRLDHGNHYETGYSHLSRFADGLKVGDKVKTLQIIGYVGSTGRSTGPHLHFGVKKDGQFIDPESLHLDALVLLPEGEREAFAQIKANYDRLLDAIALPEPVPATATPTPNPVASEASEDDIAGDSPTPSGQAGAAPTPGSIAKKTPTPVSAVAPQPVGSSTAPAVPATAAPSPPQAPASTPVSIYMSNRELLKSQPTTDDGEVDK